MHPDPLESFIGLSLILTGERRMSERLAPAYYNILEKHLPAGALVELLQHFEVLRQAGDDAESIGRALLANPMTVDASRKLILLWFVGGVSNDGQKSWEFVDPEHYFSGLVWSVVGGHPPGISGGYSGHWRYPAE